MIFDSKRRQAQVAEANEVAEAEAATLVEAPRPARSIDTDDLRSAPGGMDRFDERASYLEDEPDVVDAHIINPVAERADSFAAEHIAADRTREDPPEAGRRDRDELEPLFPTGVAEDFRRSWDAVQIGFVDDPQQAVQRADALVNQVLQSLSETFTSERSRLEAQVAQTDSIATEDLRVALRRYRSFLHRLLAL